MTDSVLWLVFVSYPERRLAYGPFDSRLDAEIWAVEHNAYFRSDHNWTLIELHDKNQVSRDRA